MIHIELMDICRYQCHDCLNSQLEYQVFGLKRKKNSCKEVLNYIFQFFFFFMVKMSISGNMFVVQCQNYIYLIFFNMTC